jgi:hypothetical protein
MTPKTLPAIGRVAACAVAITAAAACTAPVNAQTPQILYACYVPETGLLYRIDPAGQVGLPAACFVDKKAKTPAHVLFSWNAQGIQGAKGDPGAPGVAGPKGDTGAPGAAGADGAPGAKGDKGDRGDPGAAGTPGVKGDTGSPGAAGADGAPGAKGDAGAPGAAGTPGAAGAKGDTGARGPSDVWVRSTNFSFLQTSGTLRTLLTLTLPAGTYLINAFMTIQGIQTAVSAECFLNIGAQQLFRDISVASGNMGYFTITGSLSSGSNTTVTATCTQTGGTSSAGAAVDLVATQVTTLH